MAQFLKLFEENPSEDLLDKVVDLLRKGGLIIYPTDTVYGIGCDITHTKAMEKVAAIKGVKLHKAHFSFICHDLSNLSDYVQQIDRSTYKILKRHLPGPYTFVLPGNHRLPKAFRAKKTVGIRVPDNRIIRELVKKLGNPIVSTSIYDEDDLLEYTTDPSLIYEKWHKRVDLVIDGGYGGNIPSTIVSLVDGETSILRMGRGSVENL